MITCHLGFKRDSHLNPWVKCAELNVQPTGESVISFTGLRQGLLQGKAFDDAVAPYIDGDLWYSGQWVGFMQTNETETGVWYTAVIEVIPVVIPSPSGIAILKIKDTHGT